MNIKVTAIIDGEKMECLGIISFHPINDKQVYISWQIVDIGKRQIAGVSKAYYITESERTEKNILKYALEDILKYRINRKKLFSNPKISD